jgi:hypothetical protein
MIALKGRGRGNGRGNAEEDRVRQYELSDFPLFTQGD